MIKRTLARLNSQFDERKAELEEVIKKLGNNRRRLYIKACKITTNHEWKLLMSNPCLEEEWCF